MVLTGTIFGLRLHGMFERFTARARNVVVYASEEARRLNHNYIGTEHLLLALLRDDGSVAFAALRSLGATPEAVRAQVAELVKPGSAAPPGHLPFTPRAKKVLETALRDSLRLNHNYIGTEHILLGLSQGDGIAAQVLHKLGVTEQLRDTITGLLPPPSRHRRRFARRQPSDVLSTWTDSEDDASRVITSTVKAMLDAARAVAGNSPVASHHLLAAAVQDPNSAAAKVLQQLNVDLAALQEMLASADVTGTSDETPEEAGRRHLTMRVSDGQAHIDIDDNLLIDKARELIGGDTDQSADSLSGSTEPAFADLWLAINDVLDEIARRRAA